MALEFKASWRPGTHAQPVMRSAPFTQVRHE